MSTQWLVGSLDHGNASDRPKRQVLTVVACVVFILVYYVLALFGLWNGWQSFEWYGFWMSAVVAAIFSFVIPGLFFLNRWTANRVARAQVAGRGLLEIAAAGDDQLIPPVAFQPMPLALSELPLGKTLIGPLKRVQVQLQGSQRPMAWILLFPLLLMTFILATLTFGFDDIGGSSSFFFTVFPFLTFVIYGVWIAVFVIWALLRYRGRTFTANADQTGLEWFTGRTRHHIAWDDVRSVFRTSLPGTSSYLGFTSSSWSTRTVYFIDGKDEVLAWSLTPLSGEQDSAASEALLRIVVSRTGKPLRDMTALATEVATSGRNAEQFLAGRIPAAAQQNGISATGALFPSPTAARRGYKGAWFVAAITGLLAIVVLSGGAGLQAYQTTYLANLPSRIHQQHPLFQDTLAALDSDWPNQPLDTPHSLDGMFFAGSSYQLTGTTPGNFVLSLEQRLSFADAAYEVTAHESGVVPSDGYDGVGLAFRADPAGSNFLLFQVYSSGDWEFDHYKDVSNRADDNWTTIEGGTSDAINTGVGSANKLLVILRGQYFLLYVNDQLVFSGNERYETFADSGYAGVYLNDGSMAASFQNFSVYPVAKASPFSFD